jgi:hypothetical protein
MPQGKASHAIFQDTLEDMDFQLDLDDHRDSFRASTGGASVRNYPTRTSGFSPAAFPDRQQSVQDYNPRPHLELDDEIQGTY